MAVRIAHAEWKGNLKNGKGTMKSETGAIDGQYSFSSRFEEGTGTNPEELLGAAHAGCFSMALSNILAEAGFEPESVKTEDHVHLEKTDAGFTITKIEMHLKATVPGISDDDFKKHAEDAKKNCPVSRALTGVTFELHSTLNS